jgi:hypothetical protein
MLKLIQPDVDRHYAQAHRSRLKKLLSMIWLGLITAMVCSGFALMLLQAVGSGDSSNHATARDDTPTRQAVPTIGQSYRVNTSWIGVYDAEDRDELVRAITTDQPHVTEMILARRAGVINEGETVKVVDMKGILDLWVQVRPIKWNPSLDTKVRPRLWVLARALQVD